MRIVIEEKARHMQWDDNALTALCAVSVAAERSYTDHAVSITYCSPDKPINARRDIWMRVTPALHNDGHLHSIVRKMLPPEFSVSVSDDQIIVGYPAPVTV